MKEQFIVFDLETTGVDILVDEPLQVYLGAVKEGEIEEELLLYCSAFRPCSEGALNVHGLSPEVLKERGAVTPNFAAGRINNFIWNHQPAALLGHNCISFDYPMLWNFLARYTGGRFKHPPVCQVYDTMHLFNAVKGGRKWMKLKLMAEALGVEVPEGLHDARVDGLLTWRSFCALRGGVQ